MWLAGLVFSFMPFKRASCKPSKGADGRTIDHYVNTQLLSEWVKFLGTKFQRSAADAHQNLESLDDDELRLCLRALGSRKATGWDNVPVEAYRGSVEATNELFRICHLMWRTEQIPPDLVRLVFMIYIIVCQSFKFQCLGLPAKT